MKTHLGAYFSVLIKSNLTKFSTSRDTLMRSYSQVCQTRTKENKQNFSSYHIKYIQTLCPFIGLLCICSLTLKPYKYQKIYVNTMQNDKKDCYVLDTYLHANV